MSTNREYERVRELISKAREGDSAAIAELEPHVKAGLLPAALHQEAMEALRTSVTT